MKKFEMPEEDAPEIEPEPWPEVEIKVPQSESLAVIRARKQAHQAKLRGGK